MKIQLDELKKILGRYAAALAQSHQSYAEQTKSGEALHPASWLYEVGTLIGGALFLAFIRWRMDPTDTAASDPGDLVRTVVQSYVDEGRPIHPVIPHMLNYATTMFSKEPKECQAAVQEAIYVMMMEAGAIHEKAGYPRPPDQETTRKIIGQVLTPSMN